MAFEKGNEWWRKRAIHGRNLIFSTPEKLWEAAVEYFEYTDSRKWIKKDWVGKDATEVQRETETPYTISGLCIFLDCEEQTFNNYEKRPDFLGVVTRIKRIMFTQKYEGAAVGAFNHNIISRDLGLTDKKEFEHSGAMKVETTEFKIVRRKSK